jgi:hypothetical protein
MAEHDQPKSRIPRAMKGMHSALVLTMASTLTASTLAFSLSFAPDFTSLKFCDGPAPRAFRPLQFCHRGSRRLAPFMTATQPNPSSTGSNFVYDSAGRQRELPSLCDLDSEVN